MKNYTAFLFEDLKIFLLGKKEDEICLYPQLIENGVILDLNYVYYLMKKKLESIAFEGDVIFLINSSKFLNFEIDVSNIKKDETESYIHYELQKLLPESVENYYFTYEYDETLVKVRLVEKSFLDSYKELAKLLKLNLVGIFDVEDAISENNYINYSLNRAKIIEKDFRKDIFSKEISKKLEEYDLNAEDIANIYNGNFNGEDSAVVEKLERLLESFKFERIAWLKRFLKDKDYIYFGDLPIENLFGINLRKLSINDLKLKNNFIDKKSSKSKYSILAVVVLIAFNVILFCILNNRENTARLEFSNTLKQMAEEKSIKDSKKKESYKYSNSDVEYNKKFEKLVQKLENFNHDEIFFEEYRFYDDKVNIKGIANSTNILKRAMGQSKNAKLLSSSIKDGYLYFEIEVVLRD